MEQLHADVLRYEHGVSQDRIRLLGEFDPRERGREIEDPFGQSNAVYQESYDLIRDCIVNYLDSAEGEVGDSTIIGQNQNWER
jgi:protein-tyrosine-phosphatase